jgi:microcystin-dependent protein
MSTPYIGEIRTVGFTFAPIGWLSCQGQLLPISEYDALYALIGTTYGGDGQTTFALPNFQSRLVPAAGTGVGLSNYVPGITGGTESVTLTNTQMPAHGHPFASGVNASTGGTATNNPASAYPHPSTKSMYRDTAIAGSNLAAGAITGTAAPAGGSQPHPNIQPVLALNCIICTDGIFPSQP